MPEAIPIEQLSIVPLNEGMNLSGFCCQDKDLEAFLKEDALTYQKAKLAATYLCLFQNGVAGYVTLATDSIKLNDDEKRQFAASKARLNEYPGIKIARLAVQEGLQGRGLGRILVKASLGKIAGIGKEVGCRFATVDAIPDAEAFYGKIGFVKNMHKQEKGRSTISMRYDLLYYTG